MKNNAFKRLMSLLLVVVMVFGMLPSVYAAEGSTDEVITSSSDPPVEETVETTEEATNPTETTAAIAASTEATTEASEETTANTESSEDSTEASSESADETTAPEETTAATEDSEENPQTPTDATDETEVPTETTVETEAPTDTTDETEAPTEAPTEEAANPTTESTEATYPVSDPTADVESEWEMEATFADVELTEDLVANFLAIAESQLGYKESTKNFIIDDNGEMKGYTRYGDWWANGYEYGDWCAMFVSFCLYYSGIEIVPLSANCQEWVEIMQAADGLTAWYDADDESYAPEPGDIIFYDLNGEGTADHVGIIKEISKDGTFLVYEGNYDDSVAVVERENNQSVLGFIPVSLIVYYSATVPLTTLVEDNSCRIYWLNGKNALYSYSYKDAIGTTHSGSFEALTTYTLNGVQAYCIEPVKTHGSAYTQSSSVTAWNTELSANQRQAIALALAYGYPNTTHADSSTSGAAEKYQNLAYYQGKTTLAQWKKAEKIAATQLIIWEIVTGARQATPPYKCTNTWLIDAFFYDAATNPYGDWSDWYTLKQTYDEISTSLANHGIPSFCSDSASGATTYKLIANSSGNYTLTLTDTNGVLSGYSFSSSISGLTMSRSGNTLTITATPAAAATLANSTVTISATGSSISIDPSKAVAVWSCDNGSNKQSIVTLATSPSAMTAYFKLSADAQFDATIAKVSSDNSGSLSGYKIKLWNSTTNQSWNAISDENGNFVNIADNSTTFKLTPGTYDILEFLPDSNGDGNPDSYPYEVTFATYTGSSLNGYTHYYSDNGVLKQPNWTTQSTGTAGTITLDVSSSGSKLYSYSSWPSGNYYQARLNKVSINLTSSQSIKITVSNAPQPGTATMKKTNSDNSDNVSNYAFKLYQNGTGLAWYGKSNNYGNIYQTYYGMDNGSEVYYGSYGDKLATPATRTYSFEGLKDGTYSFYEILSEYGKGSVFPNSITIKVTNGGSTVYNQTFDSSDIKEDSSGNAYISGIQITGLSGGGVMTIEINNEDVPATATMKKTNSGDSDNVSNYAFKLYQNGTGLAWYGKSNNIGNIYQTYYGMDNGSEVYYGSYGDKLATPATRTYSFEGLKDGTYSFYEILSEYGKGSVFPNSITIKVTNGGSTVYNKTFDSSDIKEDSSGNAYISSIQITGLSGGGVMTIEINNEDVPGTATIKKTSTSGNVNGYAFKLYQSGTGLAWYGKSNNYGNIYQTYYGKNDGSEVYYGSYDEPLATPTLNRTYSFEGLKDGTYSLFEILSEYGKGSVFPDSITIKVTNGGSTVYNQTFDSSSIEESGGNAVISNIEITGLSGGGVMTITINNKPIAGKHTMVKISDTNDVNGYAFRLSQTDTGLVWCGRSNNEGNIYQTYYGYDDGSEVYYGSANEPYAVPSERSYTFDELTDGTYSFSEILSVKGKGNSFPESITITVTNGSNTVFSQVFDSSSITKDEDGNAVIPAVNITGLDDGGSLNITIKNVSTSQPVTIVKTAFCDEDVYDQISGNTLYSLAGAKYDLYVYNSSGVAEFKETLITDANGTATSSGYYECGTTGYLIETEAPPGYILDDESKWDFVIDSAETTVVNVTDEPVFDPGWIPIQKINANTTVAQGNTSFEGAIFKWEYFTNYNCSGEPERVWYFTTDANGRHDYDAEHLINTDKYPSNSLYVDSDGIPALPLGSVRITEVVAPLGYTAINTPLTATIKQNGNDAKFAFTADTVINVTSDGSYGVTEDDDITTWASIAIQKVAANPANVSHDDTINFAGCEFTVYNNSGNPVCVGDNVAQPGEACYVLTVDANGYAATGDIFPIGSYTIKETKGNDYYLCNTEWSASFDVTGSETVPFAFTCENTEVRGNFLLYKVEENTNTNTSDTVAPSDDAIMLAGATYKFWYPNGDVLGEYTTDENGMIQIDDLPYGVGYKYQEIIAPEGFELDEEVYSFDITENGTTITRTREDVPILGSIKVKKVDADGNTLTGIPFLLEFSLDDGQTWSPVTAHSTRDIYRYYCSRCGNFAMQYLVAGGARMCGICRSTLTQRPYKTVILYTLGGCTSEGLQDGILYTDENGECIFTGLRVNSQVGNIQYRLTELATENGYTLLADYAFLGELPYTFDDNTTSVDIVVEVVNNVVFEFPATGENDLFMVTFGAILAVFAIAMFVMVAAPTVFNGNPAVNKKSKTKRSKQS